MDVTTHIPHSSEYWLKTMLHKRGLEKATFKPLFTYQLTDTEYQELKIVLKRQSVSGERIKSHEWCAAFCLFCSEWYRREYKAGWSWDGIWVALSYKVEANQRPGLIEKGFVYWGRRVNRYESERNDYLGSIFSEGGLPFGLLASEGSRFQQLFKKLLGEFDKAKSFGVSPIPLIQKQLERMPDAFKQDTTVLLLNEMVERLYGFIDHYELDTQSDPVMHLDHSLPLWRNSFPIPLDDSTGNEFLAGLLKSAASQRQETKKQQRRLTLTQWLSNTDELGFSAKVVCDKQLQISIGRKAFSHPNAELLIYEGKQQLKSMGRVRLESSENHTTLHLRATSFQLSRKRWEAPLSLVVMQDGTIRYQELIPSSAILLSDMPVVLEQVDEVNQIVGQGSFSKKASNLCVVAPSFFEISNSDNSAVILDHTEFDGALQCTRFSGDLTLSSNIEGESDQYIISTKADAFSKELLEIVGPELEFETVQGYPVYKGLPKLRCLYPDAKLYIGDHEQGEWDRIASMYGRQVLRVKVDNKTLYRRKIAILPNSLEIKIQPGNSPRKGSLLLNCEQNLNSRVTTDITNKVFKTETGKRFDLSVDDSPPAQIELEIRANLLAEPIALKVPFPARGALLFDGGGNQLSRRITVEDLLGARALLFSEPNKGITKFDIELRAPTRSMDRVSVNYSYTVRECFSEINLYELSDKIKELLATSDGLDETVRMVVSSPSCDSIQFQIGRYTTSPRKEGLILSFDEREVIDFGDLHVELINLENPEEKPIKLQQRTSSEAPIGKFELPLLVSSPRLAVPARSSKIPFRSVFIAANHSSLNVDKAKTLNKAVSEFHPVTNPNAFLPIFEDMVVNFSHSGWLYLDALFENYAYLPMQTFEVWKSLAHHPKCLVCYLFVSKHKTEELMQRFQTEFNIVWELIPLQLWHSAISRYRASMAEEAYPEELINIFSSRKKDELVNFLGLSGIFKLSKAYGAMYPAIVNSWREELLRSNAENDNWPTHYSYAFNQWVLQHNSELMCFDIPHQFQTSVMLFPIVAAAVVSNLTTWSDVLGVPDVNNLLLRQIMDFDHDWFNSVFQCCLSIFATE